MKTLPQSSMSELDLSAMSLESLGCIQEESAAVDMCLQQMFDEFMVFISKTDLE